MQSRLVCPPSKQLSRVLAIGLDMFKLSSGQHKQLHNFWTAASLRLSGLEDSSSHLHRCICMHIFPTFGSRPACPVQQCFTVTSRYSSTTWVFPYSCSAASVSAPSFLSPHSKVPLSWLTLTMPWSRQMCQHLRSSFGSQRRLNITRCARSLAEKDSYFSCMYISHASTYRSVSHKYPAQPERLFPTLQDGAFHHWVVADWTLPAQLLEHPF